MWVHAGGGRIRIVWSALLLFAGGLLAGKGLVGCSGDSTQPPILQVRPTEVNVAQGDTVGAFTLSNVGRGDLSWSLRTQAPWIRFERASGTTSTSEELSFLVDRLLYNGGPHEAPIEVSSNGGNANVGVRLLSALEVTPAQLIASEHDTTLLLQVAPSAYATGTDTLRWTAGVTAGWMTLSPSAGTLLADPVWLSVTFDRAGRGAGDHEGEIWFDAGVDGRDTVRVVMTVASVDRVFGHVFFVGTRIPVPGVSVRLGEYQTATDDAGYYELAGVRLGPMTLSAAREGFEPYERALQLPEDGLEQTIYMATEERAHSVTGSVRNSLGTALRQALVVLLNPDGSVSQLSAVTGADGSFVLPGVPDGHREIRVDHPVYEETVRTVEVEVAAGPQEFVLVATVLPPPLPRNGPVVQRIDCSSVRVAWEQRFEDTLAGYRVERAPSSTGPFVDISGLVPPAVTAFRDDQLDLAIYTYRLRSITIDGGESDPSEPRGIELVPWVSLTEGGASLALKRWGHAAFYYEAENLMLVHAGVDCAPTGTCESYRDMWALDLETYQWSIYDTGSTGPSRRNDHSLIHRPASRQMVLFAGRNEFSYYSDLWAFEPGSRVWTRLDADAGEAGRRWGHSAVYDPVDDRMIVYGGRGSQIYNDVWAYAFGAQEWTLLWNGDSYQTEGPRRRHRHAAVYDPHAHRMIVHGGWTGSDGTTYADTWGFDLTTHAWTALADSPRPWQGHTATRVDGWTVVCGEPDWETGTYTWAYDLVADVWTPIDGDLDDAPPLRQRHSAIHIPGTHGLVIYGGIGIFDPIGTLSDSWTFCPVR
jgi:hypothetical protein